MLSIWLVHIAALCNVVLHLQHNVKGRAKRGKDSQSLQLATLTKDVYRLPLIHNNHVLD